MKLNFFEKWLSNAKRSIVTTLLCVSAVVFFWQSTSFSNVAAIANPINNLIASKDAGDMVQEKVSKDAGRAKGFIRDTADRVEETAKKNAAKVDQADDKGSFVERKAKKDAGRIEKRAEEDAARTQKAVDNTKNAVEKTVDSIKDALSK
ncbi:hypothetical protein C7H19_12845 [Aphanothece hegewaldii CCALA 016]|uniref:Uncharacterized protein n=1 Tax=Aphanothece hegewaldii CCALA 016 TaxID=2107694 RepID=A0A2T1LXD5_9CHRO|nr:hypothetical protein [Aphanothece hegewaldii]PSF36847.1 hypothetical protein C7H19_12845 [Aphanothece hegewaldii CCALA 016]